MTSPDPLLAAQTVTVSFGATAAVSAVDLPVARGEMTAIIGPNGCGKSTLLRTMGRLLAPDTGTVTLDGADISTLPTRDVARRVGILPQAPIAPEGLSVIDLVSRGRDPYRRWYDQWSASDEAAVHDALRRTDMITLADRPVDALSGGQRQRAWIAMALAQGTEVLLLDEPTTYLDVVHQIDVLDLVRELHDTEGTTVVMVLHDLSMAARYADRLVAMRDGQIVAEGSSAEVISPEVLSRVFDLECEVLVDSRTGRPIVVPIGRTPEGAQ